MSGISPALRAWLSHGWNLRDYGDGLYKLSCAFCGPALRDVPLDSVTRFAELNPRNPCEDFALWEAGS